MKPGADTPRQFRPTLKRRLGRQAAPGRPSYRPTLEVMENRELLAASFFAPAEPVGSVAVQLAPLGNVTAGAQEMVTFGLPFTRGSVAAADLGKVRVLKSGAEIPAFVEQLTPWRSIDDPGIDGQSVRVARIQIPYTFASLNPETITVQWGGPARTLNVTALQDPRLNWHTVTGGSFVAADNVQEPDVLPVLPGAYLSLGMLDAPTTPTNGGVAQTRDNPAVMNATTFPGYTEYDSAEKNFFYTIINQNGTTPIDYKTQAEPWLYDRSAGMYELYFRSGFATALREAVRSTDFYVNHLSADGFFTLKPDDPKYAYNEALAYTYWLLGDNRMLAPISTVVHAFDGTQTHWTPNLSFWTERNSGDKLLATEVAYEVTGGTAFKAGVQTIVGDLVWHQNGAGGQLPGNRIDGGLYHLGFQHDLDEVSSANVLVASSWMSALLVDPMVRVYGVWQNNAHVPDFIIRIGNFEKAASLTDADGQFGGTHRYPDYLMRPDGTPDNRSDTDVQHAMDVGAVAAWATYFAELRGTPDPSLRQLANDLYSTYDVGVNFWTSTSDGYTVEPPRRYTWEYKNSPSFAWALTAADAPGQAGLLRFSAPSFSVVENEPVATITVTRTNGSTGGVSVHYATGNGTATAGSDYTAASGTLTFADGETSKTFTVPITNDTVVENQETVLLTLSNPTGGAALDSPATATLTIDSDDTTTVPLTATYQQGVGGYTGTTDVDISNQYVDNGATNTDGDQLGVYQTTGTGAYTVEGLIRFDNLGITTHATTDATVTGASLTLTVDFETGATIRGYYLAAPWSVGPGTDLGWLHTGAGADWNTPGARGQGTDVIAGRSFVLPGVSGTQTVTIALDPAVVQSWIDNPSADQGILLVNETTGAIVRVDASENATVAARPRFSVSYTVSSSTFPGALQFNSANYNVNENGPAATITVTRTGGSTGSVSVHYATSDGPATAGNDYTAASGTLTFADGETSKTFTVQILDDNLVENNETFNLTLSNPTGGAALGTQAAATVTILDNDVPQPGALQFSASAYTVNENQGTATITVTRTGGSNAPVSVHYATSDGTATAGSDYTTANGTLSFGIGETSKTFTVPITNDALVEGNETVNLTLSGPTNGATLGGQTTATLTIVDDDTSGTIAATFQQGVGGYTGTTDASITNQNAQFTSGNGLTDFTSNQMGLYQTTGTGGYTVEDLIRFSNLGIPTNATVVGATLTLTVDSWDANPTLRGYYVLAPWSGTPGPDSGQLGWLHRGTGQDWNTPGALGQGSDVVGGNIFVLPGIRAVGEQTITITLDPAVVQNWISNPGANQGILLVNESPGVIVRTDASEDTTVAFRPKLNINYNVGTPTPQPGSLQFSNAAYSVNENGGTATITVARTGGSGGTVTVHYATSNGTATAGADYTAASGTLTFADGETSKTFTVSITDDALVEGNETVNFTLGSPTGGATLGGQSTATLTIQDDDIAQPGALQFSASAYTVNENQGSVTITVTRTGGGNVPVTVHYATSDGTATAGSDYTATSGTLTFGVGETSKTFTIPITNDTAVENPETVTLTLSIPTGGATLGSPATATLTIISDDTSGQPVTVTFQQGVGGYTGTTDVNISTQYAQFTSGNGTTTLNGTDMGVYQTTGSGSYLMETLIRFSGLGIPAGATVSGATLTLSVYTWDANATVRGYYLAAPWNGASGTTLGWLHRGTGQDWNSPGALGQGTDVIANNSFVLPNVRAVGQQTITVTLDPAVVQSWVNNPGADQGILLVNTTPGKIVRVNASENAAVASRPRLSVTYNAGNTTPPPGTLQFGNAAYSVSESGGTATITVTRTGGSNGSVTIHYATSNGTATAGSDYTAGSGTLTFADGETSKTFTVPITNDALVEGNETVNLTLDTPTGGATLGGQATATLTILDDDVVTLQSITVSPVNPSVANGQTIRFTATGHFSDGSTQVLTSGVSWGTSNSGAATIAANGLASAVGTGSVTISAADGNFASSTTLTVTAALSSPTTGAHTLAFVHFGSPAGTLSTNPITTQASGSTVLAWVGRGQLSTFTPATTPRDNLGNTSVQIGSTHSYAPNFPNSGMALYAFQPFAGGGNDIFSAPMPVNDEVTLLVVEIKNGGVIQDAQWNQVANDPQTTLSVTTTGPATLVTFWTGDGASGAVSAVPNNGFTVLESQLASSDAVQASVATKDVSAAGTYNVTWSAAPAQTAYMWLVAVQHGTPAAQPPSITQQPASQTVTQGQPVTFTVTASSTLPLTYQWQRRDSGTSAFVTISGATAASFTLASTTAADSGAQFRCVVTNSAGSTISSAATLTTVASPPPPTGRFTDVTDASGVGAIIAQMYQTNPDWWLSGEHLVDLDNDGHLDLFLDSHGGGDAVAALNDGRGHFTRVTTGSFPTTEIHEMFDINGDGKVDLNATFQDGGSQWWINHSTPGHVNFTPTTVTRDTNTSRSQVLFDFNGDGKVDWFRSAPPGLVVDFGDGNGGFTEGSLTFPIAGTDSNDNASFLPGDFDGDGKTDLLILTGGNYDGTPGKTMVWHNNGNLTFTDVTAAGGLPADGTIVKGVGNFDQDGDLDLIAIPNKSLPPVIYLNDGHGHFTVKPNAISGVAPGTLDYSFWGTAVVTDVDNDGVADILLAGKYYLKVLRGTGGGNFTYMNDAWGIKDTAAMSVDDGLTFGDIDGDGRLDVIGYDETFPTRTLTVYHNDLASGNWLNVRPVGLADNVGAAGATISIYAAGTNQLLWDEQVAQYDFQVATSYYGYDETERHFGLGNRTSVDVVVKFADGRVTRLNNVAANQTIVVPGSAGG